MEKMISHLGVGNFPAKAPEVYKLIQFERDKGAPASRFKVPWKHLHFVYTTLAWRNSGL